MFKFIQNKYKTFTKIFHKIRNGFGVTITCDIFSEKNKYNQFKSQYTASRCIPASSIARNKFN